MPLLEVRVCENGVPAVRVGNDAGDTTMAEVGGLMVMLMVTMPRSSSSRVNVSLVALLEPCVYVTNCTPPLLGPMM
ncbi:hypothetical protein D9M68_942680 [compost metagenome]